MATNRKSLSAKAAFLPCDFEPNPGRAIWVEGALNQSLVDRLQPEIQALTSRSTDPIAIFINSPGGSGAACDRLLSLLGGWRTITVATHQAESAAAILLSSGDWAIALPESKLLYHGTTIATPKPIDAAWAVSLSMALGKANREATASVVRKSARRFAFVVSALR